MVGELDVSPIVPSLGSDFRHRPLLGRVPADRFPDVNARTAALRLPDAPAALTCACSTVPGSPGGGGISQVPGQPLRTCRDLRSRWSWHAEVPGPAAPAIWHSKCCLPRSPARQPPLLGSFGTTPRPIRPLSTLRSFPSRFTRSYGHARLASAWRPPALAVGTFTHGLVSEVSGHFSFLFGQAWPDARGATLTARRSARVPRASCRRRRCNSRRRR